MFVSALSTTVDLTGFRAFCISSKLLLIPVILLFTSTKTFTQFTLQVCYYGISKKYVQHWERPVFFFYGGAMDKEKKDDNSKDNKPMWKYKHTPLRDRKTSSGITFWPKKIEGDNDAD